MFEVIIQEQFLPHASISAKTATFAAV